MKYYIYKIENLVNHRIYIGLTNNIARRRARHFTDLRRNKHDNHFLLKEFNIYHEENFSFSIEFEGNVTDKEIGDKEKEYILFYDSYKNGYNQNEGGNFGASNGGTTLTEADVLNILAALEFMTRPGLVLSDMFNVSRTTISRIKKGINHNQYKEEYESMPLEERKAIFKIFQESSNIILARLQSSKIEKTRLLTRELVLLILANEEFGRIVTQLELMLKFNISSSNTIRCIVTKLTYLDVNFEYEHMTIEQKQSLATILREQYMQTH